MGWESSGVVGFDLGPLLQGQTRIAKGKSAYNSLISLLANGRKLMAWPGVVFVVVNNFFQPLLLRNYCTDFFEIWYGASLGRGLSFFLIACFSTNQRRSHDQKHVFQKGVLVWMITLKALHLFT